MHDYYKNPAAVDALRPEQYYVTQESGTEQPFTGEYLDNHAPGIYVDVVSGEPLFASVDKFDSDTGWPSFTKPIDGDNIVERPDDRHILMRTEVRSRHGDSHLGHVFTDGPSSDGGLRYCINSAALRFIHRDDLEAEGYGHYASLFETANSSAQQGVSEPDDSGQPQAIEIITYDPIDTDWKLASRGAVGGTGRGTVEPSHRG